MKIAGRDFFGEKPSVMGGQTQEGPMYGEPEASRYKRKTGPVHKTAWLVGALLLACSASAQTASPAKPSTESPVTASASISAGANSSTTTPTDDAIARALNQKIMQSDTLRPLDLGVYVHNGEATLTGMVPDAQTEQDAIDLARSTAGVTSVNDKLRVGKPSATAPGFPASPVITAPNTTQPSPAASRSAPPVYIHTQPPDVLLTVPSGTPLSVMMQTRIDSKYTQPGTPFRGVIVRNVYFRPGIIAIPRGSVVRGTVIDARPSGKLKGSPQLALQLSNIYIGSRSYVLTSSVWARKGPGKGPATAATVGGAAAFGALTGAIVGGGPVALLGAALGGLGGAGLSAISPGARIIIPAESLVTFHLTGPLTVREPTMSEVRAISANAPPVYPRPRYRRYAPPPPPGAPPGGYPY
jgi:hypothetical protein